MLKGLGLLRLCIILKTLAILQYIGILMTIKKRTNTIILQSNHLIF